MFCSYIYLFIFIFLEENQLVFQFSLDLSRTKHKTNSFSIFQPVRLLFAEKKNRTDKGLFGSTKADAHPYQIAN